MVVLGLPRGGIPVADAVARRLGAPLDMLLVKKVGLPGQEELAMGAIATGGVFVRNDPIIAAAGVSEEMLTRVTNQKLKELQEQQASLGGSREPLSVAERVIIIVDDGVATGSTMRAAIAALRQRQPKEIIVAVPVGARDTIEMLQGIADSVVCPLAPIEFGALSPFYLNFEQTSDDDVRRILSHI